ncbi:MAG TPA: hypothetical protein VG053_04560 [Solirubrobacteraceae bacterium]|nr:hypothetical protein [Solirubrobacteraceae bacterium]
MRTVPSRSPAPAPASPATSPVRRLETWLWTGPLGHLLGGGVDFGIALARYLLARVRSRTVGRATGE